ncbi:MAG: hypothetical protein IJQ76_04120 [Prevotella sp.]|nr:hypothetical protein [Prevotella sp.]
MKITRTLLSLTLCLTLANTAQGQQGYYVTGTHEADARSDSYWDEE